MKTKFNPLIFIALSLIILAAGSILFSFGSIPGFITALIGLAIMVGTCVVMILQMSTEPEQPKDQ